jgi:hypothetical protein
MIAFYLLQSAELQHLLPIAFMSHNSGVVLIQLAPPVHVGLPQLPACPDIALYTQTWSLFGPLQFP